MPIMTELRECEPTPDDVIVFLHIPKTAGTTLASILTMRWSRRLQCPCGFTRELASLSAAELARYRLYKGHLYYAVLERLLPRDFVCVTFLREPIARYISNFRHLQRATFRPSNPAAESEPALIRRMSLAEFVHSEQLILHSVLRDVQTRYLGAEVPFTTLGELAAAVDEEGLRPVPGAIEGVKHRLAALTCFGLAERFQDSLFLLCYVFGWHPIVNTKRLNVAHNPWSWEDVDPETLARIEAFNTQDRELYTYAQELFAARFEQMTHTLLERYGDRAHAYLRPPLDQEVLVELLERHYEARFRARWAEQLSTEMSLRLAIEQLHEEAIGLYLPELSADNGWVCWTGPEREAELYVPRISNDDMLLSFRVLQALAPNVLASLRQSVNTHPIPLTWTRDSAGAMIYHAHVPRAVLTPQPFLRLRLSVERTLSPSMVDPSSSDQRPLGIALNWLELRPATSQALKDYIACLEDELRRSQTTFQEIQAYAISLREGLQRTQEALHDAQRYAASLEDELRRTQATLRDAQVYAASLEDRLPNEQNRDTASIPICPRPDAWTRR